MGNRERRDKSYTKENAEDLEWEASDVPLKSLSNDHGRSTDIYCTERVKEVVCRIAPPAALTLTL